MYVIQADGSGLARMTDNPERDDYPTWHPDGRLVIISERRRRHDLYLPRRLGDSPPQGIRPRFSPDGGGSPFTINRDSNYEV